MGLTPDDPAAAAEGVISAILADLLSNRHRGVIVDSPPGAGKSTLVVRAATEIAAGGDPLMVVAQTNEQVDDLVVRLSARLRSVASDARIGRLSRSGYLPPVRISELANVVVGTDLAALGQPVITIATAAKWARVKEGTWPTAIIDEAYQMRSDALLAIAPRFDRALFVGDPGQLDPFSIVENERWRGQTWDPTQSAVSVLLRSNPDLPVHRLPVSWRLPHHAQHLISAAFYPYTGFRAATGPGDRELVFSSGTGRGTDVDAALAEAAAAGWALLELPARNVLRTDAEAVAATAAVARRLVERGAVARSERGERPVGARRIAVGAAHRDQVAAITTALSGLPVTVDTANRLQGREYDVTVFLHPLSGRHDATAFHLEAGRLCVLASRHRHACVVVARAGIQHLLDEHPSADPVHLNEPVRFPDGWAANQAVLAHLADHTIPLRL
jgi:predicted ATPase